MVKISLKEYDEYLSECLRERVEESEEKEVKDIEWLKEEVEKRIKTIESDDISFVGSEYYDEGYIDGMRDVLYRINQLDEPETDQHSYKKGFLDGQKDQRQHFEHIYKNQDTLSQKWIDNNSVYASSDGVTEEYVHVDDLQNLLVPKQELPVIPKFVAEWIEKYVEYGYDLYPALKKVENNARSWERTYDWYRNNTLEFVLAYLTQEYEIEVEEEQKYYVRENNYLLCK